MAKNPKKQKPQPQAYPYFSRTRLIEVARLGQKWNYNRQLESNVKELPIARYPEVWEDIEAEGQRRLAKNLTGLRGAIDEVLRAVAV